MMATASTPLQQLARHVVERPLFQRAVVGLILAAAVLAGVETSASVMDRFGPWLRLADTLILAAFAAEIALKVAACGPRWWLYFRDGWNVFDFVIVAACLVPAGAQFAAVFRLVRLLRVLRLVTALPRLQLLVGALFKSVGAMGYVGLLLAMLLYTYGIAGVHLFGKNDPLHFGTLPVSLLTLFRVITLENWGTILDIQRFGSANFGYEASPHLTANSAAMPVVASAYFVSFILLGTMVVLNLVIGIIMNSMSEMHREIENRKSASNSQAASRSLEEELDQLDWQVEQIRAQSQRLRQVHRQRKRETVLAQL